MMCVGQMNMVPTINTICYVEELKYFSIKILTKICNTVIPKSCHQHVMRSLTPMFVLNPRTWSGNLLWISILHEKT